MLLRVKLNLFMSVLNLKIKMMKKIILAIGLLCLVMIIAANYLISVNAKSKIFSNVSFLPRNKVGLVLGTKKLLKNGKVNLFFKNRIDATCELYRAGKIEFVLVSGDNGSLIYDEPTDMRNELIKKGIPENRIFLDYAGFRTLDSVVRAHKVFGQNSITIISQKFHNERAIYLAERHGLKAIGFNAKEVGGHGGIKTKIREYFARVKVFVDLILNVQPKFLGESIDIPSKVLEFPSFSYEPYYSGCENILSQTPNQTELEIYCDTIIDFSSIDPRLDIELKFNWFYESLPEDDSTGRMLVWPNCIGISSIQTLKESTLIDEISLIDIINIEVFNEPYNNGFKILKRIWLKDVNMDSYLDIVMMSGSGKRSNFAVWIYNPKNEIFTFSDAGFGYITPIKYECSNQSILLYTYNGGDAFSSTFAAYYIIDDSLSFHQSRYYDGWSKDFDYELYLDAFGDTIRIDTFVK
jgi:SanA protein